MLTAWPPAAIRRADRLQALQGDLRGRHNVEVEIQTADPERIVRLDILAVTRLSHALAGFRAAGAGVPVNIGSIIAFAPSPLRRGLLWVEGLCRNFTRSLQLEYAKSGIQVQLSRRPAPST